jgi:glucose-6-phosphate isomerase
MDVILLEATAGQKAMMLPEYGHWTVNVTEEPLVIANWIDPRFSSYYASVEAARGPGCYVRPGADGLRLTRNGRYTQVPELLRRARTVDVPELGLLARRPLSTELPRDPARWRYLCDPAKAAVELMDAIEIVSTEPFPESSV